MIVIGLTGSIAMGKSTASAMLGTMGIPIHDSDAAVHKIYQSDQRFIKLIRTHFPDTYNRRTRSIDRKALGKIIFADAEKKSHLESFLHPKVRLSQINFLKKCQRLNQKIVVLDIPLLFETGAERGCDAVIVVTAPPHIQKKRVLARPDMTEEKLHQILAAQMPDAEKRARADYVVSSSLGRGQMYRDLQNVIHQISLREHRIE